MMLAQYLVEFSRLDEVWLTLSGQNPVKERDDNVGDADRLAMLRMACAGTPRIDVCDVELSLPRPSFTYRTLCHLRDLYPRRRFTLLIGADNWTIFDRWRDSDRIVSEFPVMIYPRPGYTIDPQTLPTGVTYIGEAPSFDISSTFLRDAIAAHRCISHFLPSGVYDYIMQHQLYGNNNRT